MSRKALSVAVLGGLSIIIVLQLISLGQPGGQATAQAQDPLLLALVDDANNPPPPDDPKLMAIGTLGASHVHTLYGYIGVMADAYAGVTIDGKVHHVYTAEQITNLTREISIVCEDCIEKLEALREVGLIEVDLAAANHMIEIYDQLSRQARALERYARTGAQEDAEAFEEIRTTVWREIATLLGIPIENEVN